MDLRLASKLLPLIICAWSHMFEVSLKSTLKALLINLLIGGAACAQSFDAPAGWDSAGMSLDGRAPGNGSPVIAEIDGDVSNGREIAVAGTDGRLHVISSGGIKLWTAALPNAACRSTTSRVNSSPAVGDLFGNGVPYVVVGYMETGGCDGGVAAYRGDNGQRVWNFNLRRFARRAGFYERWSAVFSTPALSDADNDGQMEIGFGAYDRHVYLLNANGRVRWYYQAADTVWASPAFADINNDGRKELLVATDISANSVIRPPTRNGGYLYAFPTSRRREKLIRFRTNYLWIRALNQVPWSSPAVGDVLPSNPGPEVVIASGYYFSPAIKGHWIKILSGASGKVLMTLTTPSASATSAAIADLNDDGLPDIVAPISGAAQYGGDGKGHVLAWSPALSNSPIWNTIPRSRGANAVFSFHSPVIADLDCNGSLEVAVTNGSGVVVLNGSDGRQLTCADRDCLSGGKVMRAGGSLSAAPAVEDLDLNGQPEIVASGAGKVYAWTNFADLQSSPGSQTPCSVAWSAFRQNAQRSGGGGNY